jgi:hypothetical protein
MIIIMLTVKELKTKQAQRPGYRGQQDVESEDKNCASCNWSIKKGLDQNLHLLPGHWSVIEIQKITLMSTTHIILTVLG